MGRGAGDDRLTAGFSQRPATRQAEEREVSPQAAAVSYGRAYRAGRGRTYLARTCCPRGKPATRRTRVAPVAHGVEEAQTGVPAQVHSQTFASGGGARARPQCAAPHHPGECKQKQNALCRV